MNKAYKFLDEINFPSDIRKLSVSDLQTLREEYRELIEQSLRYQEQNLMEL
tara:strand:- start:324 stop:476 length:153 start_codon:yes stop_codon:yes gene_type:complete